MAVRNIAALLQVHNGDVDRVVGLCQEEMQRIMRRVR